MLIYQRLSRPFWMFVWAHKLNGARVLITPPPHSATVTTIAQVFTTLEKHRKQDVWTSISSIHTILIETSFYNMYFFGIVLFQFGIVNIIFQFSVILWDCISFSCKDMVALMAVTAWLVESKMVAFWLYEQPHTSMLWLHPRMQQVIRYQVLRFLSMTARWCPPSYKLVYNPINYRYITYKP